MSRSKLNIAVLALGFGLGLLPPAAAVAQPLPTATVTYSDLDLGSSAGVAALNRRIQRAAVGLCAGGGITVGADVAARQEFRHCMRAALNSARPQVDQVVAQASQIRLARRGNIAINGR